MQIPKNIILLIDSAYEKPSEQMCLHVLNIEVRLKITGGTKQAKKLSVQLKRARGGASISYQIFQKFRRKSRCAFFRKFS